MPFLLIAIHFVVCIQKFCKRTEILGSQRTFLSNSGVTLDLCCNPVICTLSGHQPLFLNRLLQNGSASLRKSSELQEIFLVYCQDFKKCVNRIFSHLHSSNIYLQKRGTVLFHVKPLKSKVIELNIQYVKITTYNVKIIYRAF